MKRESRESESVARDQFQYPDLLAAQITEIPNQHKLQF